METINISIKYCEELARQKLNLRECTFIKCSIEPLSEYKCGFMGDHWILKMTIEESIDVLRFFIKSQPTTEVQKAFSDATGVFLKETSFYHKIIPAFRKRGIEEIDDVVPISYEYEKPDVLVFEDLSIKGYKILDTTKSLTLEAVKASLITFAKFHAAPLLYEEKMSMEKGGLYRLYDDFSTDLKESFYCQAELSVALVESTAKGILAQIGIFSELSEVIKDRESFEKFVINTWRNVTKYAKPSEQFRNVICHGDPWITNFMYRFGDDQSIDCKLIDYQMIRYSPPAQDVVTFLYLCTDRKFRANHLNSCLKFYHSTLMKILKKYQINTVLPEDEFWKSVEYYKPFAIAQNLSHSHITKMSPMSVKLYFHDPNFMRKFIFEDKGETLVSLCEKNPNYREKQKETILDFIEMYERNLMGN